jgi:hypothetical protein
MLDFSGLRNSPKIYETMDQTKGKLQPYIWTKIKTPFKLVILLVLVALLNS